MDAPAMLFHHAINRSQPQARPFVFFLGGEKGIEDLLAGGAIHALAAIAYRQADIGTWFDIVCPGGFRIR